eukprot:5239137-Pleurochrysis_carterae.AAC.3
MTADVALEPAVKVQAVQPPDETETRERRPTPTRSAAGVGGWCRGTTRRPTFTTARRAWESSCTLRTHWRAAV